jgi:hypothetical protein
MDSKAKTRSQRDAKGRFLSKAELARLNQPGTILTAEMGVIAEDPRTATPTHFLDPWGQLHVVGEVKAGQVIPVSPPSRVSVVTKLLATAAIASAILLGVALIPALALDPNQPLKREFELSCRARMTGLLVTLDFPKLSPEKLKLAHTVTLMNIAEAKEDYLEIAESEIVTIACDQMWMDLSQVILTEK